MKQKDNKIQEGASSLFNGSQPGEQETERVRSQRKFFLTGRRCKAPQEGNKEEIRTSFMLNRKQYDKVREIAMREGITAMDRKLHGFAHPDAVLTGPETRTSSPVRIVRNSETLEAIGIEGLYPCAEGAGYAGGILSAATDGIKVVEKWLDSL